MPLNPLATPMKLLLLPPELLLTIAETLPPKAINSLLQTSHYLNTLLIPLLHKLALKDKDGMNALSWASLHGHEPLVRLVLNNSAHDINATDSARYGWTALHRAVQREHEAIVRILLENGADPNIRDKRLQTPLLWCPDGGTDIARVLLDYGADVGSRNRVYVTRLHKAVWKRDVAMVRVLLEKGARFPISGVGEGMRFNNGTVGKDPGLIEAFLEFGGEKDVWCRRCLVRWADAIGWGEIARVKYGLHRDGDGSDIGISAGEMG